MEAYEIPGIVQELEAGITQLKETASDKEGDLQTMEEEINRARTELDSAASEWEHILEQLSNFNPERLGEAIDAAERLLGDR
jgi:chromosome segregation ATPase